MGQAGKQIARSFSIRVRALFFALSFSACATTAPVAGEEPPQAQEAPPASSPKVIAIPFARSPEPGIVTGGIPSAANLQEAKQAGYRTIVSLLPQAESGDEATAVAELGLDFVSIPVAGPDDLTEDNARKLGDVLASPSARPLILHCASGNRAGALFALHAFYVEGKSAEQALAVGEAAGLTKLRDQVQAKLAAAGPRP